MSKFQIQEGLAMDAEITTSAPNIPVLLKQKRIELDENGEIKNPKHNVIYTKEVPVTITTDKGKKIKIGSESINVNGGHVKAYHPITGKQEDTPWRMSLGGPHRYHWLVLKLAEVRRRNPTSKDQVVPTLEEDEFKEYQMYLEYMKETGAKVKLTESYDRKENDNVEFYNWVDENGVSVDEDGVVVRGEQEEEEEEEKPAKKPAKKPTTKKAKKKAS